MYPVLTTQQILSTLNSLGISYNNPRSKTKISILCPYHSDKKLGSAYVYLDRGGFFKCFSCGKSSNTFGLVMHLMNLNYKESLDFIGVEDFSDIVLNLNARKPKVKPKELETKKMSNAEYDLTLVEFDPRNYEYTNSRGFTKEFNKEFDIMLCTGSVYITENDFKIKGMYNNYLVIPIKGKGINTFEARRLSEFESLQTYLKDFTSNIKQLKDKLKEILTERKIRSSRGKILEDGEKITDPILSYLLKPKVLYPKNSNLKNTLFNYDNLDLDKDVYVVEGISGIPKIWSSISKNVTCIFGVSLTNQNDKQIELLKNFSKKVIVIPDNDEASLNFIETLSKSVENVWVIPTKKDDTDSDFISDIKSINPIEGMRHIIRVKEVMELNEEI